MKKIVWFALMIVILVYFGCNSNKENDRSTEIKPVMKDTVGTTTVTTISNNQIDSLAADSLKLLNAASANKNVQTRIEKYIGSNGKTIIATYNNAGGMGIVSLKTNTKKAPVKLMQKEANEQIESYTNGKITWTVQNAVATLVLDNVVTKYKRLP